MDDANKIKFALYLEGWSYNSDEKSILRLKAIEVTPTEYTLNMKGHIFCLNVALGFSAHQRTKNMIVKDARHSMRTVELIPQSVAFALRKLKGRDSRMKN